MTKIVKRKDTIHIGNLSGKEISKVIASYLTNHSVGVTRVTAYPFTLEVEYLDMQGSQSSLPVFSLGKKCHKLKER